MTGGNDDIERDCPERLAKQVDFLAGEVKLLAINLAITLARMENREKVFGQLEEQFTELIKKANDTAQQVTEVMKAYRHRQRMGTGLPASTEIIQKRGAYDGIEAKLNHVYKLSREMARKISKIKQQEQVG